MRFLLEELKGVHDAIAKWDLPYCLLNIRMNWSKVTYSFEITQEKK